VVALSEFGTLMQDLQASVDAHARSYNCSFSVAIKGPALGETIMVASRDVTTESRFAWGSITKMWTGASIMQLVAKGKLKLDEPFAPYVDAQLAEMKRIKFPGMNFSKVSDLWGPEVNKVTIRNLLHMQSGIPDFDTATDFGSLKDPFRATAYANPSKDFMEPFLMSVPWVAKHSLAHTPGQGFQYSSTNFGLLGLILAHHARIADYRDFNQSSFIPPDLAHVAKSILWAQRGSPRDNHVVTGFDRTKYNGQDPKNGGVSVVDVHGVFSGWAASDFVGPPSAVAELGYALWGNSSTLVPQKYRDMMVPTPLTNFSGFYGLASQNVGLVGITGNEGDLKTAYGHLGATYGYDSILGYNPKLDIAIAIATNIETQTQLQPSSAFCSIYNRVKNYLLKERVHHCKYIPFGYYGGKCICLPFDDTIMV
jgi:CubicO group peptidase (beta-lactamase class C family)